MKRGDVIAGRFELEEVIGSGGMGEIHRAIDRTTGERVALKSLRAHGGDADRFLRESQILAELSHPAIVRYVAHGASSEGELYLVMEWLEGEDLAGRLARAPLTVAESLSLVIRVAEALALVHAQGVLHRDLKPSNLFLRRGSVENVMVLDFGIARISGGALTFTGNALGTPGYMAPEQARGERDVDARADVFALGCVLFECLTGRPAFMGEHAVAILGKILFEEAPRLRDVRPEVSPALDALVARMLSKAASNRPADAGALLLEILQLGAQTGAAPLASVPPPAMLTEGEQRLLSVVMVREAPADYGHGETIAAAAPDEPFAHLRSLASRYGARLDRVGEGTLMAVVAIRGSATDQSANAARLSLDLHTVAPSSPDHRCDRAGGYSRIAGPSAMRSIVRPR